MASFITKTSNYLKSKLHYFFLDPLAVLSGKEVSITTTETAIKNKSEALFRLLFALTTIFMFIIMLSLSGQYSISGDEWIQNQYGKEIYNYFFHGDTSAYNATNRPQGYDNIIYYSGGYELFLAIVTKVFPNVFEYDVRHFFNALLGCFLFLFTALIGKKIGGWKAGFFTLLFVWLSPRLFGESFNNSKDIPFALGMMFTLYHMIPFLKNLPKPSWRSVIYIALGIGFTLSTRIGGVLLFAYLGLFSLIIYFIKIKNKEINSFFNPDFSQLLLKGLVIFVVSYVIGIATWPWALQSPLSNPMESFKQMEKFQIGINVLYGGELINSLSTPPNYTLNWIFRTSPEIVLAFFLVGILLIIPTAKHFHSKFIYFILFSAIFPVAYAVYSGSNLYDGWRHFLFVYPPMCILAGTTISFLMEKYNKKIVTIGLSSIIILGLFLPIRKLVSLHPNQYVYFNDLSGGLKGNYKQYETDYYMSSARETFNKLAEKENFAQLKDTVIIITNMYKEIKAYSELVSPFLRIEYSKFENRTNQDHDYGIFMSRFADPLLLQSNAWPAKNAIIINERDGVPLTFANKVSHKGFLKGTEAMKQKNYAEAIQQFESYLKEDATNETIWAKLGECHMETQNFPLAAAAFEKANQYYPMDQNTLMLGLSLAQSGKANEAINIFTKGAQKSLKLYEQYKEKYQDNNNNKMAGSMMQMHGDLAGTYYYYLGMIYNQMGNQAEAQNNMQKAQRYSPRLFNK